jgi:hypothetical protein
LSRTTAQSKAGIQPQVIEFAIWNPNATANWSLIFTPAFGSYLQLLNWRALGEPEKAASSQNWFYVSLGMLVVYVLTGFRPIGLFLFVWYFSAGRAQGKYVKEKFGSSYARKPWGKALLIGLAAIIGYFVAFVIVRLALGVARYA